MLDLVQIRDIRDRLNKIIDEIGRMDKCRENSLATTKIQEAIMWLKNAYDTQLIGENEPYFYKTEMYFPEQFVNGEEGIRHMIEIEKEDGWVAINEDWEQTPIVISYRFKNE